MTVPFRIQGCSSLSDALNEMSAFEGAIDVIAGGTDFVRRMRGGEVSCDLLLDLSQAKDMRYILEEGGWIRIGAGTTFTEIAEHPLIREKAACLSQAASQVGSLQIRNRATIGGNVAGGSPAADSMPPLTVLHAVAVIMARKRGLLPERTEEPVHVCGSRQHAGEILTEIRFPVPPPRCRTGFVKIGSRRTVSIAKLSMAMRVLYDAPSSTIEEGLIALGALGEEPVCADDLGDFLFQRRVDQAFARELLERLVDVVDSAIPDRESRPYKRSAVRGVALDMLQSLFPFSLDE